MSSNLLELINDNITGDVISKLADFLGESPKSTSSALSSAIPSILAGLVNKSTDTQGASTILSLLNQGSHDGGILNNLVTAFSGGDGTNKLLATGATLLNSIFGHKMDGVANLIANASGISKTSSNSLLGLLMPVIFGVLGKTVKSEGITSAAGLASFLGSQSGFLKNLLPAGLSSILGIANLNDLGKKASATAAHVVEESSGGFGRFLPWLLLPLLLALGWGLFKNLKLPTAPAPEVSVPNVSAPDVSMPQIVAPVVEKVGDFFETTLSSGFAIKGAKDGIENKLIVFIQDTGKAVDETIWFSMDGITFDTDKATLTPESTVQVTNIAEILKAFPNVKIKIGGYTDNTGDANHNLTLSGERANTVKNALVAAGIDASRLEAKGYGSEHPVATNETEEGRQQNRRIDVQVTAK
jgi:outer membrane protein OmpA-like peptidoglycan-associated protein